jgi:hypothetical protein
MLLTDFDALTFDCYGTLIDWESGMVEALKGLTDRLKRPLTREQLLEAHARHESSQQKYTPAKAIGICCRSLQASRRGVGRARHPRRLRRIRRASSTGPRSSFMAQVSIMGFQKFNGGVADDASPVAGGIA